MREVVGIVIMYFLTMVPLMLHLMVMMNGLLLSQVITRVMQLMKLILIVDLETAICICKTGGVIIQENV